jgi:hypothetical protein
MNYWNGYHGVFEWEGSYITWDLYNPIIKHTYLKGTYKLAGYNYILLNLIVDDSSTKIIRE